jgi:hypothetical protein
MDLMVKFIANIAMQSNLDINKNQVITRPPSRMSKQFRERKETEVLVQDALERCLKRKEWSQELEISIEIVSVALNATRNWIPQLAVKVPMLKCIVNRVIHLNLVPKLEQSQRKVSKRFDRIQFPICTKLMTISLPELLLKHGPSKPKRVLEIVAPNAMVEFLRLRKWSQHQDHGIIAIASDVWIVLVCWIV